MDSNKLQEAKNKLQFIIEEGFDNQILSKEEFDAMSPQETKPGKFYCLFKVHKEHIFGQTPPERPIVSICGSMLDNTSRYVEHYIKKKLSTKHPSYIKDTPHF